MIRHERLSREARKRQRHRLGTSDNHKLRRHWGKIYINAGFKQELLKIDPNGRKHWYYVRSLGLSPSRSLWY